MIKFIHSSHYFFSNSSSPLLLSSSPTQHGYCARVSRRSRFRQLGVKDLFKVPTWQLERDSNLQPFGQKASNPQWATVPHKFFGVQLLCTLNGCFIFK